MTLSDLKTICNYSDKQMNLPKAQLMYIDMISSDDEEYQRMIKQKNRELVVDALLDDKVEELETFRESNSAIVDLSSQYNSTVSSTGMSVISPRIMQIDLTSRKFESYEKCYNEVIDFLNQNTQNPKSKSNGPMSSLDITLQGDFDSDYRKIVARIMMCSSIIAMDGRIGTSTSFIYGKKTLPYIKTNQLNGLQAHYSELIDGKKTLPYIKTNQLNGLQAHYSELIDDDKIIVCRGNNLDQPGVIFIDNSSTGNYFFDKTPNWQRQYCWFRII